MTEITATPEIIRAANWLAQELVSFTPDVRASLRVLLAALPEEVTNPKPELPSEPGWYESGDKTTVIWIDERGAFWCNAGTTHPDVVHPERFLPLTRLVPEGPPLLPANLVRTIEDNWTHPEGTHNMAAVIAAYVNGERS